MSTLMTVRMRRRTESLSGIMKCQHERDFCHVLHPHHYFETVWRERGDDEEVNLHLPACYASLFIFTSSPRCCSAAAWLAVFFSVLKLSTFSLTHQLWVEGASSLEMSSGEVCKEDGGDVLCRSVVSSTETTSEAFTDILLYIFVVLCSYNITNVSNNVQTREIHKFHLVICRSNFQERVRERD